MPTAFDTASRVFGGKIQGDSQKFLDHFKSYFGSQISLQSLNEVHIYRLQPNPQQKASFIIYFCLFFKSAHHVVSWDFTNFWLLFSSVQNMASNNYEKDVTYYSIPAIAHTHTLVILLCSTYCSHAYFGVIQQYILRTTDNSKPRQS